MVDANGDPVGKIEEVYAEPEEHRATHVLISYGTLSREKKIIPTAWLDDIYEDSVRLYVGKKLIENLPDAA